MADSTAPSVDIVRWARQADAAHLVGDIDRIFFVSSNTQSFASDDARAAFRQRWLGRYLEHFADYVFVALTPQRRVIGYVTGSLEDPARSEHFRDIGYFVTFRECTARFPAQLHINLAPEWRGQGIGRRLIEAFCDAARLAGAPGAHAVTTRGMRNVRFYLAQGFFEAGRAEANGRELLFLARNLLND